VKHPLSGIVTSPISPSGTVTSNGASWASQVQFGSRSQPGAHGSHEMHEQLLPGIVYGGQLMVVHASGSSAASVGPPSSIWPAS
jgi:hypothetical protein